MLCIETSHQYCSLALVEQGTCLATTDTNEPNSHARLITILINNLLQKEGIKASDLAAIAVSAGPGSYTGLRVGSSTAKGLCYGLQIPLIAISTLQTMASVIQKSHPGLHSCPLIDARRMEVFTGLFNADNQEVLPGQSAIIDGTFMQQALLHQCIAFGGNGLLKTKPYLNTFENAVFAEDIVPSASAMAPLAWNRFELGQFEDPAWFEPQYLKEFYGTKPPPS